MTSSGEDVDAELALADTSLFIAVEQDRPLSSPPQRVAISLVTVGELRLGALAAQDGSGQDGWRHFQQWRRSIPAGSTKELLTPGRPCALHFRVSSFVDSTWNYSL